MRRWPSRSSSARSWLATSTVTPDPVEPREQVHDVQRQVRVEVAGRLVGDQQRRPGRDGAGDADALLLARGQHDRRQVFLAEQPDLVERRPHPAAGLAGARAGDHQRQADVVEHRPVAQQLVVLEHHADMAAEGRHLAARNGRGVAPADQHLAAGGALDAGDELQERALARAGMSGQERHLAGLDAKAQVADGVAPAGIALEDLLEADHCVTRRDSPCAR
jgi:hypothetical protein